MFAAAIALAVGLVHAQSELPNAPKPGFVVGSGHFYTPIVANLEEAVAFYRDGLGFEFADEPQNADASPELRAMIGLPDTRARWQVGTAPGIQGGVQVLEVSSADGQRLDRRIQEPSVVMLMVVVRDLKAAFARVQALGAPVVTRGGFPVTIPLGIRAVVVLDPAGHFVELLELPNPPRTERGNGLIRDVLVRHTVDNLDRAVALYRDALGLEGGRNVAAGYYSAARVVDLLGVPRNTRWRYTTVRIPGSGLPIELIEFKDGRRPSITIQDEPLGDPNEVAERTDDRRPVSVGATLIQFRVAGVEAAADAVVQAGGTFVSTGGKPLDLPSPNGTLKVGLVRDADGLLAMLIDTPQ